jgi:hypothetical protein
LGLAGVFLVGFGAWVIALDRLPSDYDEVYHAHAIWLIGQGDRPYHDFLAVHTPYLWYAVASLLSWLPDSPQMLLPLRILAGIGTLIWLTALIANFCTHQSNVSLRWMLAGLAVVLFSTPVLAYAVEFRPDAWAFALYFGALFNLRRGPPRSADARRYTLYAFLATCATVGCLKVAPIAVLFAFFDLLRLRRHAPDVRAALLGHVSGAAAALGISWLFLKWTHLDVSAVFQFAFQFQVMFKNNTGFSHGLLKSLLANPLPLLCASSGLICWAMHLIKSRTAPDPFHVSVVAMLLWELFQVHRPYKQYYGPWLLMAAPFFAYIELFCRWRNRLEGWRLGFALVIGGMVAAASITRLRANELGPFIQQLQFEVAARSEKGSFIIAPPPFHPIVRRDTFYAWSRTTDPHGYTTERAMTDLGFGEFVSPERYREEIGLRDPSIIVLPLPGEDLYEPLQWQIIIEFLRRNADRYVIVKEGFIRPFAVKRADQVVNKLGQPNGS